jgi:hypothetical protein
MCGRRFLFAPPTAASGSRGAGFSRRAGARIQADPHGGAGFQPVPILLAVRTCPPHPQRRNGRESSILLDMVVSALVG